MAVPSTVVYCTRTSSVLASSILTSNEKTELASFSKAVLSLENRNSAGVSSSPPPQAVKKRMEAMEKMRVERIIVLRSKG